MRGWRHLKAHGVEFNILCTVNAANQTHGREVYRFFRDELGAKWIQFIPIVERATPETLAIANQGWSDKGGGKRLLYTQTGDLVTDRSVGGEQYGRFLIDVFEEWVRRDVGKVFVQLFDVTLEAYFGRHLLCIHAPTCGYGPALEHNGDVYTCDHFVEPGQKLGNIAETPLVELVASPQMRKFGDDKRDTLTRQCRACDVRLLCNGGCPKDRFALSKDGEPGHNYLCAGLELFFTHTRPLMGVMGRLSPARPSAGRRHALGQERGRQARPLRALPVRERARSSSSATATRRRRRAACGVSAAGASAPLPPAPRRPPARSSPIDLAFPGCRARGRN